MKTGADTGISKRWTLLAIGIVFHLVYLWSIFDIYFVSPLVHGMQPELSTKVAPAKRLFLIVGDGQRADKTLAKIYHPGTKKEEYLAPFLRSVILNNGTYGLSHTRMPTESRPGHVAMIAGFYEDVSAVTKGWKENPVDFDSVFNQSTHTYSFGSPDILPMFKQGATPGKVDAWQYGHEFEDFTSSSIELDRYVFNHLYQLFDNSTKDAQLNEQIRQDGNVFFLHLLGTDTSGHSYRPYSSEYYDNIKYTDYEISKLVGRVHEFFGDEETAFVFTADHGMSDFGSHGDGHPNNTRTPLICWGKGCNKPVTIDPQSNEFLYDEFERKEMESWDLDHIKRHDVKQADIAPLISYLVGLNYPMNSVGELPIEFIDDSEVNKVKGLYQNSLELLQQYYIKLEEVIRDQIRYKEYQKFEEKSIDEYRREIESLIAKLEEYPGLECETIQLIREFNTAIIEGLDYLQKYNWMLIRSIVALGFAGWIVYAFFNFLKMFIIPAEKMSEVSKDYVLAVRLIFGVIGGGISALMHYQNFPINYQIYLVFPVFYWYEISKNLNNLITGFKIFFTGINIVKKGAILCGIVAFFQFIAVGFEDRRIFSLIYLLISVSYPVLIFKERVFHGRNLIVAMLWFITCLVLSLFPIQNPVKVENLEMIVASGVATIVLSLLAFTALSSKMSTSTQRIIMFQLSLVGLGIYSTSTAVVSLSRRDGLPLHAQILGWFVLVVSLFVPIMLHMRYPNGDYQIRFLIMFLLISPTFVILTISFETFFLIFFTAMLNLWIEMESLDDVGEGKNLKLLRISMIGFFNLQIAFFGTGNISSISTFSLDAVYRLIPIFNPFSMGVLLMVKLILPYVLLSAGIGLINMKAGFEHFQISLLIISLADLLSLWFFFNIRTEGSWLDIGVSISNYCLAIFGSLFICAVELISTVVLRGVVVPKGDVRATSAAKKKVRSTLKMEDEEYKEIARLIEKEEEEENGRASTGASISSRVRKRQQKEIYIG